MNDRKLILWIHGFAGCPDNQTVQDMRKYNPEYEWYSIEVDHHAKASMAKINVFIADNDVSLVAGTSLGGYYAMCADFEGPKLVVNPVTDPVRDLRQFIGRNTYKPGRPDGQTDFDFTEHMLMEFGELHHDQLLNVLCHYTAHDQVLGEDIKENYQRLFYLLKMIDEKTLPSHFLTHNYAKSTTKTIDYLMRHEAPSHFKPYNDYGGEYRYLPKSILHVSNLIFQWSRYVNFPKLLCEVEQCIKDVYDEDNKQRNEPWNRNIQHTREALKMLFFERKCILTKMFRNDQVSFNRFRAINNNLLDLHNRMTDKMASLYTSWLNDEKSDWHNDCQVSGRIFAEQTTDAHTDYDTVVNHDWLMERIEELGGNVLFEREFSGSPDQPCDRWNLGLEHDSPCTYFGACAGFQPDENFTMCHPFQNLYHDSLYAPQDILRIKYFWCDTSITHQRIINSNGELQ